MSARIRFNAFDMNCVVHQSPGLWRHPDDHSARYTDLDYWTELAKLLEKGLFDGIFLADVLGVYDLYGSSPAAALRTGAQTPVGDPVPLVSAMATVTEHLGFGLTTGTGFEHPFPFARRISTLDHLTRGRVGWNVVTGYLPSAAENLGQLDAFDHDRRYDNAEEYLEVLYKLWEGSWEDEAVVADRQSGIYVNPDKVHPIEHQGAQFTVPGIHVSAPSPQRTPVIYQAGASPRGTEFAATHAEAVFVAAPTKEKLAASVARLRASLVSAGRERDDVLVYALLTIITDGTDKAAHAKAADFREYVSSEGALALMSGWMGTDFSGYELDEPIGHIESNAVQSAVEAFRRAAGDDREWTVRDLAEWGGIGGLGPVLVGSGESIADQLESWVDETGVDGFNLAYAVTPGTFADVITHVVPVLQRRGRYPTAYEYGTLRHKLFGGGDRVSSTHPADQHHRRIHTGTHSRSDDAARPSSHADSGAGYLVSTGSNRKGSLP